MNKSSYCPPTHSAHFGQQELSYMPSTTRPSSSLPGSMLMVGGKSKSSPPRHFMFLSDYIIANSYNHLSKLAVPIERYHPLMTSVIGKQLPRASIEEQAHINVAPARRGRPSCSAHDVSGVDNNHDSRRHLTSQAAVLLSSLSSEHRIRTGQFKGSSCNVVSSTLGDASTCRATAMEVQSPHEDVLKGREVMKQETTIISWSTTCSDKESSTRFRPYQSGNWMERYSELVDFKRHHGHCLVPNNYKENPPLAEWVKRQRYQYKLRNLGEHNSMTQERINKLETLGFVWNSHDQLWKERLNDLKLYKEINGDCNVPNKYPPDPSLAVWVKVRTSTSNAFMKTRKKSKESSFLMLGSWLLCAGQF